MRVIDEERQHLGVLPLAEAVAIARERGLDLVEVDPNSSPPVCRLLDYGKFKYEQAKKDKEARKHHRTTLLREVRFRPKIDPHDMEFKIRTAEKLLHQGDKVKVTVRFRGREMSHLYLGRELINRIEERLKAVATVETGESMMGRAMSVVLVPLPPKPAKRESPVAQEEEVQA